MDKLKAKKLLFKVIEALEENNIDYFLKSGTLLGAIREKNFISYDTDIDLGTKSNFMDDYLRLNRFLYSLVKRNLKVVVMRGNWSIKIKGDDSLHVDIDRYFLNKNKDKYYSINLSLSKARIFPKTVISNVKIIPFLGKNICIPDKPEQYLELLYGKNWRIAQKQFCRNRSSSKLKWIKKIKFQHIIPMPDEKI